MIGQVELLFQIDGQELLTSRLPLLEINPAPTKIDAILVHIFSLKDHFNLYNGRENHPSLSQFLFALSFAPSTERLIDSNHFFIHQSFSPPSRSPC